MNAPKSTNPFEDDSDDEYTDEAIAQMLDDMDIDADFNCWTSFRASMSITKNSSMTSSRTSNRAGGTGATIAEEEADDTNSNRLTDSEQAYIDKWAKRLCRDEVYSRRYLPVPRETREIKDLAVFLGVSGKEGGNNLERTAASKLLFPNSGEPRSVLLKRGPVLLGNEERELILLSHGIIIATPAQPDTTAGGDRSSDQVPKKGLGSPAAFLRKNIVKPGLIRISSGMGKKVVQRHFESAKMLSSVSLVEDMAQNMFAVFTEDSEGKESRYVFTCAKLPQKRAWVDALRNVLAQTKKCQQQAEVEDADVGNRQQLFGNVDSKEVDVDSVAKGAVMHDNTRGAVSRNMKALQERGDKLERLENKTADLEQGAANYREAARQLKEKAKKQSVFGI